MKNTIIAGPTSPESTDAPDSYPPLIMEVARESSTTDRSACARPLDYRSGRLDDTVIQTTSILASESAEPAGTAQSDPDEGYWESVIGSRLADYQIESHLGRGSMARVYRARHLGLDRLCALKIMDPRLVSRQPAVREQFWAEARAAANLSHPGERLPEVIVEENEGKDNERFLSVFSVCGPAQPSHYASALALNGRLTYGSLSIRHVLGAPMLVMSRTFPRDRVRASEIRDAIIEIARRSDQIEQQLTQLDQY